MSLHTPGIWGVARNIIFGPTGNAIAKMYNQSSPHVTADNARRIVLCVNAHDTLMHALDVIASGNTDPDRMVEIAREAIASTQGEQT